MDKIKSTAQELQKIINIDNVIGDPIETEDKILIPVMRMGFGFGAGENLLGKDGGAAGAGAGLEPISMVMIPKKGNTAEGVRVLSLSKAGQANKALSDLGLIISDLVKKFIDNEEPDYDESEYIEPEFTTTIDIEDEDKDEEE